MFNGFFFPAILTTSKLLGELGYDLRNINFPWSMLVSWKGRKLSLVTSSRGIPVLMRTARRSHDLSSHWPITVAPNHRCKYIFQAMCIRKTVYPCQNWYHLNLLNTRGEPASPTTNHSVEKIRKFSYIHLFTPLHTLKSILKKVNAF